MITSSYPFQYLGKADIFSQNHIFTEKYRFVAKHRTYIVTIEIFDFELAAIKFCDRKDLKSKHAYKKEFNDGDAIKVISTCLYIMLDYWSKHKNISFAFYAVPRIARYDKKKPLEASSVEMKWLKQREKSRFNIYQYAMLNIFHPDDFLQRRDTKNSLYVLINRRNSNSNNLIEKLRVYLEKHTDLIFELDIE